LREAIEVRPRPPPSVEPVGVVVGSGGGRQVARGKWGRQVSGMARARRGAAARVAASRGWCVNMATWRVMEGSGGGCEAQGRQVYALSRHLMPAKQRSERPPLRPPQRVV